MTEIDVFATVIHSCQGLSTTDLQRITTHYGGNGYVAGWMPGKPITQGAVHFSQAQPAVDRNDIENWNGQWIRILSMTTALIETKGLN